MNKELEILSTKEMAVSGSPVPFLYFKRLAEHKSVKHGCSTRVGGVSEGCFSTMNLGFGRGDADENVLTNYDRLCNAMGFTKEQVVLPDQVHDTVVRRATKADCGKGIIKPRDYSNVDAQITDEPGWLWWCSVRIAYRCFFMTRWQRQSERLTQAGAEPSDGLLK